MKNKIFTLFLVLAASIGTMFAYYDHVIIGELHYYLDNENQTAEVIRGIGYGFDDNYSSFTSVDIPASVTFNDVIYSVTCIGYAAFNECYGLTSVTIPNSVTHIKDYAFGSCTGLTSVTIPNSVTRIESAAFANCSGITSVTWNAKNCSGYGCNLGSQVESFVFGDDIEVIPASICYGMSKLTSIIIPNNVTSIGESAFYNCSGLTSITIPDNIKTIGRSAFYNCSGLEVVYINNLAAWCGIDFESAEANPLYYAHNLRVNNSKLTNLVIPDGVTRIGSYAFAGGTGLTVATIPESVTSIGAGAFQGCSNLVAARCSSLEAWCGIEFASAEANPIYYVHSLTVNGSSITDLVIPESVTNIKSYAFVNCQKLASVTIGDGVTSIGGAAFQGCLNITEISIPNSVESIGGSAFYGCSALASAVLGNGVESIGDLAFYNCSKLNTINIPASVTSIGDYAFYNCYQLKEVYINDIGAWCTLAFGSNEANPLYTNNYSSILYLDSVKLTDLVVPEGIENISSYRFNNCTDLTSVTLPESFSSFESSAFNGCYNIQRLTLNAFAPPTGGPNSGITNTQCNLYVPEESLDIYANAYWWEDFANIRAIGTARFVNFVDWDKTVLSAQDILVGESAVAPEDPTREGHTFTGWDKDFSNITEDLTITALYKINKYRVEFVDWDGTLLKVDSVEYQSAATAPEDPTRAGYAFINWDETFDNITGDLTVTAQYGLIMYYYNSNDSYKYAINIWNSKTRNEKWYYWMTPVEGHEGWYQFVFTNTISFSYSEICFVAFDLSQDQPDWSSYRKQTCASSYDGVNMYYVDGKWWQNSFETHHRVEFFDWDGTLLKVDSVEWRSSATPPEIPTREGYIFFGWDKDFSNVTEDMIITALYYKESDLITVRLDPHSCSEWEDVYLWAWLSENGVDSYFSPFNYSGIRVDIDADGWYSYTFAPTVKKVNIIWFNENDDHTIGIRDVETSTCYYLDSQSGTEISVSIMDCDEASVRKEVIFKDWDGSILKTDSVNYFASAIAPANPTRTGYNFIGWDKDFSRITEDLVVTAQYEMGENTDFTIYFVNGNDKSEIYVHDVVLRIPAAPEIEGFTFLGWRPVEEFIDSNTLEIEAVYEADEALSAPSIYTNPANPAQKLIRDGNVYVLKGEKVYTVTGQKVK